MGRDPPVAARFTFRIESSPEPGAVGLIALYGDLSSAFEILGLPLPPIGAVTLVDFAGIDRGLVARWSHGDAHLMPHGGPVIIARISEWLSRAGGLPTDQGMPASSHWPEAMGLIETRMLEALSIAKSPLAIDLLLDQPRRWHAEPSIRDSTERDVALRRLIHPPLVAAIGRPNIGKSSLANALARHRVSLVADQPGTTRDHIGVTLELDGLALMLLDCPGVPKGGPSDELEAAAVRHAVAAAAHADLLLLCGDAATPPPSLDEPALHALAKRADQRVCRVALRADLGLPPWPFDVQVSAPTGLGLELLGCRIRELLVPTVFVADSSPWRFWDEPSTERLEHSG